MLIWNLANNQLLYRNYLPILILMLMYRVYTFMLGDEFLVMYDNDAHSYGIFQKKFNGYFLIS